MMDAKIGSGFLLGVDHHGGGLTMCDGPEEGIKKRIYFRGKHETRAIQELRGKVSVH